MLEFAPRSTKRMTYEEALLYCQFLEYDGYRDWRMLTIAEYEKHGSLFDWYLNDPVSGIWCVVPVRDVC